MRTIKKGFLAQLLALWLFSGSAVAQTSTEQVKQESLDWGNLRVRPNISIYIPYVDLKETTITGNLNLEAYYQLANIADLRAGVHVGSFQGVSAGGTWHLTDQIVNKSTKFTVASLISGRTETTHFYRNNSDYRVVTGPTAQIRVGKFGDSGFYMRLDGGFDRQIHSRAYYKGFASNRNGFTSIKLLGTAAKFNQSEMVTLGNEKYVSRFGAGGLVSLFSERRPWKRITLHVGLDLGYMKIFGVKDLTEGVSIENNKSNYILDIKGGLSISL